MILVVGLGNPGAGYIKTRHNIGFIIIGKFLEEIDSNSSFLKFNSEINQIEYSNIKVILAKPLTFVNNSGPAVFSIARHYNISVRKIMIIHDDLDIEFGIIKLKKGGSTGGHKGLESVAGQLDSYDFNRLRFGIGRPPGRMDPSEFVLSRFKKSELKELDFLIDRSISAIKDYIDFGIDHAMNEYNKYNS